MKLNLWTKHEPSNQQTREDILYYSIISMFLKRYDYDNI